VCSPKRSSSFPRRSPDPSVSTAADRALARRADCARDASRSHVGASGYTAGYDVPQDSRSIAADDRPGPGVPRPAPGSRDRGGRDACRTVPRRCVRGGARRADPTSADDRHTKCQEGACLQAEEEMRPEGAVLLRRA
jgi:hypothetical protein